MRFLLHSVLSRLQTDESRAVLGMDQRLQTREEVLSKALERAEAQATRYQSLAKEMDAVPT